MFPATTGWQTTTPASCRRCRFRSGPAWLACLLIASTTTACRTVPPQALPSPSGEVSAQRIEPSASDRYAFAQGATYDQPRAAADNPLPAYPVELLAQRLAPQAVRARLIVDTQGRVVEVRALDPTSEAAAGFAASVHAACATWRFSPLTETRAVEQRRRLPDGDLEIEYVPETRALPFHLDYRFVFRQVDGRPVVDVGSPEGAGGGAQADSEVIRPDLR